MVEKAFVPFPVGVVQIGERTRRHGIRRLAQQPVFVLKRPEQQA